MEVLRLILNVFIKFNNNLSQLILTSEQITNHLFDNEYLGAAQP